MTDRELMQQALDALDYEAECGNDDAYHPLRHALRERLAQPEQEPVAWVYPEGVEALNAGKPWVVYGRDGNGAHPDGVERIPLYLAPRQWQGLTDEEINNSYMFWIVDQQDIIGFGKSIETKLRKKNT